MTGGNIFRMYGHWDGYGTGVLVWKQKHGRIKVLAFFKDTERRRR